jgi:transposase-like protein
MTTRCPLCQSENISKSKRRGLLESLVFTLIHVRPYRCQSCDLRFFRRGRPARAQGLSPARHKYSVRLSRSHVPVIRERECS